MSRCARTWPQHDKSWLAVAVVNRSVEVQDRAVHLDGQILRNNKWRQTGWSLEDNITIPDATGLEVECAASTARQPCCLPGCSRFTCQPLQFRSDSLRQFKNHVWLLRMADPRPWT